WQFGQSVLRGQYDHLERVVCRTGSRVDGEWTRGQSRLSVQHVESCQRAQRRDPRRPRLPNFFFGVEGQTGTMISEYDGNTYIGSQGYSAMNHRGGWMLMFDNIYQS